MATEEEENEDGAPETPAEQRSRNYWWLSLAFIFLFLAGGGFYALNNMGTAAHKLVSGENYTQLSSNSAAYSGAGALQKSDNFFSSDEQAPLAAGAAGGAAAGSDMLKDAEARQLLASGADSGAASSAGAQAAADGQPAGSGAMAAPASGTFSAKLQARTSGLAGRSGSQASKTTGASGQTEAFEGGAPAAGKPSVQRETNTAAAAPKKGASTGVLSALKGAFRASFYGARIASHDSARSWIAKTFDATPEYNTAIQYDDKMRTKLDKINPDSIPKFLREQDVSAAEAKTLTAAEVGKPVVDVEGTKEALKNDKDYQTKKMVQDAAAGAIDPIGKLFSRGGNTSPGEEEEDARMSSFANPEDEAAYNDLQLSEYVDVSGDYGAECGCTQTAPCCCLPQNTATNSCPMYGPFLPDDPCGNYSTGLIGDFPPLNTEMMPS